MAAHETESATATGPWTLALGAGAGSAAEVNRRCHDLLDAGANGLAVAFDLPTRLGRDSDDPVARGNVGRAGVAVDSVEDMRALLDGLPLNKIRISLDVDTPATMIVILYQLVAAERGFTPSGLCGSAHGDALTTLLLGDEPAFPPAASLRLVTDLLRHCAAELPAWDAVCIGGHRLASAGATPAQEVAFAFANALEYLRAATRAGLAADDVASRFIFLFSALFSGRSALLERVATYRAARRVWAAVLRDTFGVTDPRSLALNFHVRAPAPAMSDRSPQDDLARVGEQALAAVLGGAQGVEVAAADWRGSDQLRALRIVVEQTDAAALAGPPADRLAGPLAGSLAGSQAIESLTADIEAAVRALLQEVQERGGAIAAIRQGFQRAELGRAVAEPVLRPLDDDDRSGLEIEAVQGERLSALRATRDAMAVRYAIDHIRRAAVGTESLVHPIRGALRARATVGEVYQALREVWGTSIAMRGGSDVMEEQR